MKATSLSKLESRFREQIIQLPPWIAVQAYSMGRRYFLNALKSDLPKEKYDPPEELSRILWGIKFKSPIMNAAGMFKNGDCYEMTVMQGAGAYLGGTGTWNPRKGNKKNFIYLPFIPYPESHSSSNCMGLPNDGDISNFIKVASLQRIDDTPLGWSIMGSPDLSGEERLDKIIDGANKYSIAGVDFIELNYSCPNVGNGPFDMDEFNRQMMFLSRGYVRQRKRDIPIIVKLSNDTESGHVPQILDILFEHGFDGVNFGNTSTKYEAIRESIHPDERKLFDYYTKTFKGGISGRPLKKKSLELCTKAVDYTKAGPPSQEFHVIRTGGIETWEDVMDSERAGISLNQWFTGYFESFAKEGHDVYKNLYHDKS